MLRPTSDRVLCRYTAEAELSLMKYDETLIQMEWHPEPMTTLNRVYYDICYDKSLMGYPVNIFSFQASWLCMSG